MLLDQYILFITCFIKLNFEKFIVIIYCIFMLQYKNRNSMKKLKLLSYTVYYFIFKFSLGIYKEFFK